jgi:uncharacterized membrane protein
MNQLRQQRAWFWIAAIAVIAAVVLLMVPHANSAHAGHWLAMLPILFVGYISPLMLFISIMYLEFGYVPDAPQLPSTFQRPPPILRG